MKNLFETTCFSIMLALSWGGILGCFTENSATTAILTIVIAKLYKHRCIIAVVKVSPRGFIWIT